MFLNITFGEDFKSFKKLLCERADPNVNSTAGDTPLHLAARFLSIEKVQLLLQVNANPNAQDNRGETPLHKVSILSNKQEVEAIISLLRQYGANPNIKNHIGKLPIDLCYGQINTNLLK